MAKATTELDPKDAILLLVSRLLGPEALQKTLRAWALRRRIAMLSGAKRPKDAAVFLDAIELAAQQWEATLRHLSEGREP